MEEGKGVAFVPRPGLVSTVCTCTGTPLFVSRWKLPLGYTNPGSLVPRPSLSPVFDRLQYAKTDPEGLVNLTM